MERITSDIIEELKKTSSYDGFVDLIVASQIIDSQPLYEDGIQRLKSTGQSPSTEQAKRMGAEATHTVMMSVMDTLRASNSEKVASIRSEMNVKVAAAQNQKDIEVASVRSLMNLKVTAANIEKENAVAAIKQQMIDVLAKVDNTRCRFCQKHTEWACSHVYCRKIQTTPTT
jgi:hypothetical protein